MANLRVLDINAADSRTIMVKFSDHINPLINKSNILVEGLDISTPNAKVKSVTVSKNIVYINTLPLTPFAKYKVTFLSTDNIKFSNNLGNGFLIEDGRSNTVIVSSGENPDNIFRDNLVFDLQGQPYNPDKGTIIRDIFNQLSDGFLKARNDIRQSKNDNYLNINIKDERKQRGFGPFDRLDEEGAFEVTRVGLTPEDQKLEGSIYFDFFPSDIISLQAVRSNTERIVPGNGDGTFNGMLITVNNKPVTKLISLNIAYEDGSVYEYDIRSYGYQIKTPTYDRSFASAFVQLNENQIRLSEKVLDDDSFRIPGGGDEIFIVYEYKKLGKIINKESVNVTNVLSAIRQATPPLSNEFSLGHAPIVTSQDTIPTLGGVSFLDPNSESPFNTIHPAFKKEIVFNIGALPKNPGEYSVDYNTGRVFVYGAETNDGTGDFPPAATYKYREYFRNNLDYIYNPDTYDLVASPIRDLVGKETKISFLYEQTLVPDIDYKANVHKEVLAERIGNNIISGNSVRVKNAPITNVFKIFNETTGESYRLTRFNNDIVYFSSNTPPSIQNKNFEKVSFHLISNEQLIIYKEFTNSYNVRIFKINFEYKNIISASEDVVGASYNSSVIFSRTDIFENEIFYDYYNLSEKENTDRLSVGQYQINYRDGVAYVAVENSQGFSVGTVSYKAPIIVTKNQHIISVSDIYNSINTSIGINKHLNYSSFEDGFVYPNVFDYADERFLNNDETLPYIVSDNTITVSNNIKSVRYIFDLYDLNNNLDPINFADSLSVISNTIELDNNGVEIKSTVAVGAGLEIIVPISSPGISLVSVKSAVRTSDFVELIDGYESISGNTLTLSASSGANIGDVVDIIYNVKLNNTSTVIVDYNRGDYYIDYTYLEDEIIVSYEYGDNVLDFRESESLNPGQEYFVNYKVGALRDSLLENFGSLIDIIELNNFNIDLDRELYRDAVLGALQSFTRGPTIPSMQDLVSQISKIKPEIIESVFDFWELGTNPLFKSNFILNGNPELVLGRFDHGIQFSNEGDAITFPISSNLRLEEGTMEMTVIPQWDGIDNDAVLTFSNLMKDGYELSSNDIYIGSSSFNPEILSNNSFCVSRFDTKSPIGLPSAIFTKTGLFIYYDEDNKKWNVLAKESTASEHTFNGTIESSGEVYDVKPIPGAFDFDDIIRSTNNKIDFVFNINSVDANSPDGYSETDGYMSGYSFDGISFMADESHYFFDFAENETKNRFSLFKDGRGYLNFVIWDCGGGKNNQPLSKRNRFMVSADIQGWKAGDSHHIAISWKLNTIERKDEMHLFIDGFEVPNIIRFGGIPASTSTDRFRTIKPELMVGTVAKNAVAGNTLITTQGSNIVTASGIDFGLEGIVSGDSIEIREIGFGTYTIISVNGSSLTLDANMPVSFNDARFSVNPYSAVISSEVDIYKNILVSSLLNDTETEIPGLRATIPGYSISKNSLNQNVLTILGNAKAGSEIAIRTLGVNHRRCRESVYLWNNQAVLKTHLPPPINLDEVSIKSVLLPYIVIGPDNSTLSGGNFEITLNTTEVSNKIEGRQLEIRISGGNVDFTTPTTVTINGTSNGGVSEVLSFSSAGSKITTNKWMTISSIEVVTKPISILNNSAGIEIKEAYSITNPNGNNIYPVIRFSYQTQYGSSLESSGGDILIDNSGFFPKSSVGNLIVVESPPGVAGTYIIEDVIDINTIKINSSISSFSGGSYKLFNVNIGRSGFQNGFFFLEQAGTANIPFELPAGYYEFDYSAFLQINFNSTSDLIGHIGSDFNKKNQAKAVIDEFRILSTQLTDTRVGESLGINEESITTGALSTRPFEKNNSTLVLLHFDEFPIINDADYIAYANRHFIQSASSVNENFGQSIFFDKFGLKFDNNNRLNTNSEGSIEFWVSPKFDTYNDPVERVYFDAASSVVENITSISRGSVKLSGLAREILSVRLATDIYATGTNYFIGGSLEPDSQTIKLGTALPYQQSPVIITYIPSGLSGDRITIYKDKSGFISYIVKANGTEFELRQPVFWERNTWHRIKATFKFNSFNNQDEMRLFVDGEQRGNIRFGQGLLFGDNYIFGQTYDELSGKSLMGNIDFTDHITQFFIGQDFAGTRSAKAKIDNFRLSNKALNTITIGGQQIDVNYSSNKKSVYPVIENNYTTFLLDFDKIINIVNDFAILRDSEFGIFNFTLNIIDSFRIIEGSPKIQVILEAMIRALKPANAKVKINYLR